MDRPQLIRRLRIAASVFFAVVAVALCVLWVRSYWYFDTALISLTNSHVMEIESGGGFANIAYIKKKPSSTNSSRIAHRSFAIPAELSAHLSDLGRFRASVVRSGWLIRFPYWLAVIAFSAPAYLCSAGLPTRFSLRTLMIVITLLAVVLGLGVWVAG